MLHGIFHLSLSRSVANSLKEASEHLLKSLKRLKSLKSLKLPKCLKSLNEASEHLLKSLKLLKM